MTHSPEPGEADPPALPAELAMQPALFGPAPPVLHRAVSMTQAGSDARRFVQGCPRPKPAAVAPSPPCHASAKPSRNVVCLRSEPRATSAVACSTAPLALNSLWRGARKLYPRVPIPEPLAPRQVLAASHPEWCQPRQWLLLAIQKRIEAEDRP